MRIFCNYFELNRFLMKYLWKHFHAFVHPLTSKITRMDPQGQGAPKVPSFLRSRACDNHPLILYFLKSCVFLSIILNLKLFHSRATVALYNYWGGQLLNNQISHQHCRFKMGKKVRYFKYFNILSKSFISQIFTALRKVVQLSSVCSIKIAQDEWLWWVPFGKY